MQFSYRKFPSQPNEAFPDRKHLKRPVIPIGLKYRGKKITYLALVDFGADFCIFHAEVGEALGIDIRKGNKLEFFGVTGQKEQAFFHELTLVIGGHEKKSYCGFTYQFSKNRMPYGILGQKGFFNLFEVCLDYERVRLS